MAEIVRFSPSSLMFGTGFELQYVHIFTNTRLFLKVSTSHESKQEFTNSIHLKMEHLVDLLKVSHIEAKLFYIEEVRAENY